MNLIFNCPTTPLYKVACWVLFYAFLWNSISFESTGIFSARILKMFGIKGVLLEWKLLCTLQWWYSSSVGKSIYLIEKTQTAPPIKISLWQTHKTSLVSVVYYTTMLIDYRVQSPQSCCCGRQPHFLLTKPWSALCLKRNQALFMPIQAMCKSMKCQTQERDFSLSPFLYMRWFPQNYNSSFSSPDCVIYHRR